MRIEIDAEHLVERLIGQHSRLILFDADAAASWAARLEMPADSRVAEVRYALPDMSGSLDNYTLVAIGRMVRNGSGRESRHLDVSDLDSEDEEFEHWLDQIYYKDSVIFSEAQWLPDDSRDLAIRGDIPEASTSEIERARRDLDFLSRFYPQTRRGRPTGSGLIRDPREVSGAYSDYILLYNKKPSQEQLAEHMGHSDASTLKRFLRKHKDRISWPPA